jgi:hypothetical protein
MHQVNRLPGSLRLFHVLLRGGFQPKKEGKEMDIIRFVAPGGVFVQREQRRGLQQESRLTPQPRDLLAVPHQAGRQEAAVAAQGDIEMARISKGGRLQHAKRHSLPAKMTPEGQFHRHLCHALAHLPDPPAAKAGTGLGQGAAGMGSAALDQVGGAGQAQQVRRGYHFI